VFGRAPVWFLRDQAARNSKLLNRFGGATRSIAAKTLSIQLFSNTGHGSGTVVSRSDMDGRWSSER
jgi:hypothetical protein